MTSFENKWGDIPDKVSSKKNMYAILATQILLTIYILVALQPPFVTISGENDYSCPKLSIVLVFIVTIICIVTSLVMNDNLKNIVKIYSSD